MKLVIGVSGASGAPYAHRLLTWLAERQDIETHVVFSKYGRVVWDEEVGTDPRDLGLPLYAPGDMMAPFASGSARFDAMVVIPCSAGQLARIAHGLSQDLVGRAADVMLKERRPLVLVLRETPCSLVTARNMAAVIEAGATVMPASPGFYGHPRTVDDIVDGIAGRALDQLGIDNDLAHRWEGAER